MKGVEIIYPMLAMIILTIFALVRLGHARYKAVKSREVSIKYFRAYNEGELPNRLQILNRHLQNHFEVPPLFYIAVLVLLSMGWVNIISVCFAWAYVGARYVHTYIHLGNNNIVYRFNCFAFSLLTLLGLWGCVTYHSIMNI